MVLPIWRKRQVLKALEKFIENPEKDFEDRFIPLLTVEHMRKFQQSHLDKITRWQVAALSPDVCKVLSKKQVAALPFWGYKGFKALQIASLSLEVIAELGPDHVDSLSAEAFAGFNPEQIRVMHASAFSALKPEQVAALPFEACKGFEALKIASLSPEAMAALSTHHMEYLLPTVLSSISYKQWIRLSVEQKNCLYRKAGLENNDIDAPPYKHRFDMALEKKSDEKALNKPRFFIDDGFETSESGL